MSIVLYDQHPHIVIIREFLGEFNDDLGSCDSDDETYLCSLDPKNWKDQDHYAVLGLKNKRYLATAEEIRKAYRKKILDHHPDKRRHRGDYIKDEKHDYFSCITIAYEILGNSAKRNAFDSVDPVYTNNSVPSAQEIKNNYFVVLNEFFNRKSRWSKKQPVPKLGKDHLCIDDVYKFYDFWEDYDTCRDFSYLDEEDKERGEDRETRRAIERQNRINRTRRRAEEVAAVREVVCLAKEHDPRILAYNRAIRQAKEDKRMARIMEQKKRQEAENERLKQEEAARAAERAASEERRRVENERLRKEKDQLKSEAKRERRQLRNLLVDQYNYFISNGNNGLELGTEKARVLEDMDLLCQRLANAQLHDLNGQLERADSLSNARQLFFAEVDKVKQDLQAAVAMQNCPRLNNHSETTYSQLSMKWTDEMTKVLIKAVNLLPAGTPKRWEAIAAYLNQHVNNVSVTGKDVLKHAKSLKQDDSTLRKNVNLQAFDSFTSTIKESGAVKNVTITNQIEAEANRPWTIVEQKSLEQALKMYPAQFKPPTGSTDDRWQMIANVVGTRTRRECMLRCKELSEQVRAKKAALDAVQKPNNLPTSNSRVKNTK